MLYHEKQVAALCGVHCLNSLLQAPTFSELDLAQIGAELDQLERQMLGDTEGLEGANLDDSGMFSIQVLTKALQVWGLQAIPFDNEELRAAGFDAQQETAFICNLQEHWFTIRKVGGEWWNFNSLYPAPEHLSNFYLTAYLDSLKQQGYTIFVVRGSLPAPAAAAAGDLEGPGHWWSPDDARAAHKEAQGTRQLGRARNAMETALARAAAGGGSIALRPAAKRPAASQLEDDEDADLAAAIAASMQDAGAAGPSSSAGPAAAAAAAAVPSGGSSYAEAARRAAAAAGSQQELEPEQGGLDDDFMPDEDDPELAAALAASLQDPQQQQQQGNQQQPQQELPQQQLPPVPDEPEEGAAGAITVAFRLPSGGRLARRFFGIDTVGMLAAFVTQQLLASGEAGPQQRVMLSTQFPKRLLEDAGAALTAAGVEDRSMLSVQLH